MIQFNKTIFQFTKRLALVVMLIGISNAILAGGGNAVLYTKVEAQVSVEGETTSSANGKVYVGKEETNTPLYANNQTTYGQLSDGKGTDEGKTHTYHLYANTEWAKSADENDLGYRFAGWYASASSATPLVTNSHYKTTEIADAEAEVSSTLSTIDRIWMFLGWLRGDNQDPDNYQVPTEATATYTAKWVLPKVNEVSVDSVEYDNMNENNEVEIEEVEIFVHTPGNISKEIKFFVSEESGAENFRLYIDNEISAIPLSHKKGEVTVNVPITLKKENGDQTILVKLESKYGKGEGDFSSKSINLKIIEDYTPRFDATQIRKTFIIADGDKQPASFILGYVNDAAKVVPEDDKNGTKWTYSIVNAAGTPDGTFTCDLSSIQTAQNIVVEFNKLGELATYEATIYVTCTYYTNSSGQIAPIGTNEDGKQELKDENGIVITKKVIILRATNEPTLTFANATEVTTNETKLDKEIKIISKDTTENIETEVGYTTNITFNDQWTHENGVINYEINRDDKKVLLTVPRATHPGTYEATLTLSGKGYIQNSENQDVEVTKTTILNFTAKVEMDKPILTTFAGNEEVTLTWGAVYPATHYIIRSSIGDNETDESLLGKNLPEKFTGEIAFISDGKTTYTHTGRTNDVSINYYVTALYVANEKIIDAKTSDMQTATPSYHPPYIDIKNAPKTGLQTGTKGATKSEFPYELVRDVNVVAAFTGEKVSFDYLCIFGLTTAENGSGNFDKNANYKTPCYIYVKGSETRYNFYRKIEDITSFDNEDVKKDEIMSFAANGSPKIYMTGYCPYANTGKGIADNGVIDVIGGAGENVHLYLDSLALFTISKSQSTNSLTSIADIIHNIGETTYFYPAGNASVLSFASTSNISTNPFNVFIHVRNHNQLDGSLGAKNEITITEGKPGQGYYFHVDAQTQHSAPIAIRPITSTLSSEQYITLTIDDKWPTLKDGTEVEERTNGVLALTEITGETNEAPAIDMGHEFSTLIIDGGQISMRNDHKAMSVRQSTVVSKDKYNNNKETEVNLCGFGAVNLAVGTVKLCDGTISSNSTELHCPTATTIDGGSYLCTVKAGESSDIYSSYDTNKTYKLQKISADITSSVGTIENGLAIFNPAEDGNKDGFRVLMDNVFPNANFVMEQDDKKYYASLSYYYTGETDAPKYGHESLAPEGTKVYLMLPKVGSVKQTVGWSICQPEIMTNNSNAGGSIEKIQGTGSLDNVESTSKDKVEIPESAEIGGTAEKDLVLKLTNRLLYVEYDQITADFLLDEGYGSSSEPDSESEPKNVKVEAVTPIGHVVGNTDNYVINEKVYMLLPVVAGQWKMIVPPFNVHNVYVIESYPESQIKKDYGTKPRYGDYKISGDNVTLARNKQAERLMDLIVMWNTSIEQDVDFFGAQDGVYAPFVEAWRGLETSNGKDGGTPATESNYTPVIQQLYHYTGNEGTYPEGKNWWDANYYLYKSDTKIWQATLNEEDNAQFTTDWKIVEEQSTPRAAGVPNVIMDRGEVYTMQFPATVGTTYDDWNYWTGKYILLEGYGPQEIYGSKKMTELFSQLPESPATNTAVLSGNASFAGVPIYNQASFCLEKNEETHVWDFVTNENAAKTLLPFEGFLLANVPTTTTVETNEVGQTVQTQKIAKAIKMETGEVMYEVKTEILDDNPGLGSGVPTIMNGMSLIVEPTAEGLTITPLKEQHVMLFDAEGKMIFSKYMSEEENVSLPTGVYVVRGEYEQVKAIKK